MSRNTESNDKWKQFEEFSHPRIFDDFVEPEVELDTVDRCISEIIPIIEQWIKESI